MLIGLAQRAQHLKFLVSENSPAILTGVGVVGTVSTAFLTGRASFKAAQVLAEVREEAKEEIKTRLENSENHDVNDFLHDIEEIELTAFTKAKKVWKLYIPPVGMGATTITCIIAANRISSKRIAALGIAAGISERALQEYKDKVIEKLGAKQDRDIRDEVAQERVSNDPSSREIVLAGTGEVLFYDMSSGRYFQSTVEDVKRAENKVNYSLIHYMSASLTEFYDELGLPPTSYSDSVGWNLHNKIEVKFSTTMSQDNRPCIAIDFTRQPTSDYNQKAWDH